MTEPEADPAALEFVLRYHEASKHAFGRFAPGPGRLDWATQPDPFRRYRGAPVLSLPKPSPTGGPSYDEVLCGGALRPRPPDLQTVSALLFDSMALSAWKRSGQVSWALRVNPSSGNLHPTEAYVVCGPVRGLSSVPAVFHYAPREHALEQRAEIDPALWQRLAAALPTQCLLVGLTSIHWREAWKYGERAFRYCQHDVGHALAAVAIAAAGLGWHASLLEDPGTEELAWLLGVWDARGAEPEWPDCLIAICPGSANADPDLDAGVARGFRDLPWQGTPNALSPSHVHWPLLEEVSGAGRKLRTHLPRPAARESADRPKAPARALSLREVVRRRRSAVAMDSIATLRRAAYYRMLAATLPGRPPFSAWPWPAQLDLVVFAHRITGLAPGLYLQARSPSRLDALRRELRPEFRWEVPEACPEGLGLYLLVRGDVSHLAMQVSCFQEIASDGCFAVAMLACFEEPLRATGAWYYPRLFWESGMIGQVLYLEAEAAGLRGTGIGCFFDDPVHDLLGLTGRAHQDLYHITVGGPVEDSRLTTLPAYPEMP
jgi:SagB-type dehydrogenase family enzyme